MKSIRNHALNIGKNVIGHEGQISGLLFKVFLGGCTKTVHFMKKNTLTEEETL